MEPFNSVFDCKRREAHPIEVILLTFKPLGLRKNDILTPIDADLTSCVAFGFYCRGSIVILARKFTLRSIVGIKVSRVFPHKSIHRKLLLMLPVLRILWVVHDHIRSITKEIFTQEILSRNTIIVNLQVICILNEVLAVSGCLFVEGTAIVLMDICSSRHIGLPNTAITPIQFHLNFKLFHNQKFKFISIYSLYWICFKFIYLS